MMISYEHDSKIYDFETGKTLLIQDRKAVKASFNEDKKICVFKSLNKEIILTRIKDEVSEILMVNQTSKRREDTNYILQNNLILLYNNFYGGIGASTRIISSLENLKEILVSDKFLIHNKTKFLEFLVS